MRKRTKKQEPTAAAVLAVLSAEERAEYARRQELFERSRDATLAAGAYLDRLGEEFRLAYGLPAVYDLNLQTGEISERLVEVSA